MAQHLVALTLGNVSVRQQDGLFSLNDLHKASSKPGEKPDPRDRPGYFLVNEQTRGLITEIETAGIPAVKSNEGRNGGTYACRELVIAYAAWISPAFHLKVIRVFLDKTTPVQQPLMAAASLYRDLCQIHRDTGLTPAEARMLANEATFEQTGIRMLPPHTPVAGVLEVVIEEPKRSSPKERAIGYVHNAANYSSNDRTQNSLLMQGKMPHSKLLKLMKIPTRDLKAVLKQALEENAIKKFEPICGTTIYTKA